MTDVRLTAELVKPCKRGVNIIGSLEEKNRGNRFTKRNNQRPTMARKTGRFDTGVGRIADDAGAARKNRAELQQL